MIKYFHSNDYFGLALLLGPCTRALKRRSTGESRGAVIAD